MGVGAVVEPSDGRPPAGQEGHPASREGRAQGTEGEHAPTSNSELVEAEHDQRPEHVELLLDRQAPGVGEQRRGARLQEIVGPIDDEVPVGHVEDGGEGIASERGIGALGRAEPDDQRAEGHHDEQSGQQAPGTPGPEGTEGDPGVVAQLVEQQRRDQEPRQHEEGVHAKEPRRQPAHPGVEAQDAEDGQGPDAIEGWQVAQRLADRRGIRIDVADPRSMLVGASDLTHERAPWGPAPRSLRSTRAKSDPAQPRGFMETSC